jgi:hypothetical protein
MEKMQYARITRTDSVIQFFQVIDKQNMELCPVGGGRCLTPNMNTVKSVEFVDRLPEEWIIGYASIDGYENKWRALHQKHASWNGWACPYILADDIKNFLKDIAVESYGKSNIDENENLNLILEDEPDQVDIIMPENINDVKVYNVGSLGWCFDFEESK